MGLLLLVGGAPAVPVDVTAIDTLVHGESCTITGTGFGTTEGSITLAGASQVITAWADTSATFTVDRGNSRYGGVTVILYNYGAASSDTAPGATLTPPDGWSYINLLDPLASSDDRITALPDLVGGDQLAYGNVEGTGSVVTGVAGVYVMADASYSADSWVTSFEVEAHDGITWGTSAVQTLGALSDEDLDLFRRHRYLAFQRLGRIRR